MYVELIQATPDPIETISKIASICYNSNPKNPMGWLNIFMKMVIIRALNTSILHSKLRASQELVPTSW